MRKFFSLVFALVALTACAPSSGLLVSEEARDLGGSLFIEPAKGGGSFLVLDGEITPQTSFIFEAVTEQADVRGLVIAQSPGGDLLAAHQIGRSIKRRQMNLTSK